MVRFAWMLAAFVPLSAQAATTMIEVDSWDADGGAGCSVCGDDWECTNDLGFGSWDPDATYDDPLSDGSTVTKVSIEIFGDCFNSSGATANVRTSLNGVIVGEGDATSADACACDCNDGYLYESAVFDDGFDRYVYGGINTVTVEEVIGSFCMAYAQVTLEYRTCGDRFVEGPEECDDGNRVDGDGCSATCTSEGGGDVDADTDADTDADSDADTDADSDADTDTDTSTSLDCGNGSIDTGEECDDGNYYSNDGCSGSCSVEEGFACKGAPSVCSSTCGDGVQASDEDCDDGNTADGDACPADCQTPEGDGDSGIDAGGGGGGGGGRSTGGCGCTTAGPAALGWLVLVALPFVRRKK